VTGLSSVEMKQQFLSSAVYLAVFVQNIVRQGNLLAIPVFPIFTPKLSKNTAPVRENYANIEKVHKA